jgi:hypothetical protein
LNTDLYVVVCIFCLGFIFSQIFTGFDVGNFIAFLSFLILFLAFYGALLAYKHWAKSILYSQMKELMSIYEQRLLKGIKFNELMDNKQNVDKKMQYLDTILYNKGWSVINEVGIPCDELKVAWNDSLLREDEFKHWESGNDVVEHYKVVYKSEVIVSEAIEKIIKKYCGV